MSLLDNFKDKKISLITDSDLDGTGACIVYKEYIEPIAQTSSIVQTGKRDMSELNWDYINDADIIIFTDIAPTLDTYNKLKGLNKDIWIFDHHVSSYDILHNHVTNNYYFTTSKCGTKILFDSIREGQRIKRVIAQFVELVNTYDTWDENSILWKEAKDLHNIKSGYINYFKEYDSEYDKNLVFIDRQLEKFVNSKQYYFSEYEKGLAVKGLQRERDNYEFAKKKMSIRKDDSGNRYAYIEASSKISLICNTLLKEFVDKIDYIIAHSTFEETKENKPNGKVSLRSQGNFDVTIIAEKWKGGGHKNSSGAELPLDIFSKLKNNEIHLI